MRACERGETTSSLSLLTRAASVASPSRQASVLNNRAQVRRLVGDLAGATSDLDEAIVLSGGSGRAARQAYCQRGKREDARPPLRQV